MTIYQSNSKQNFLNEVAEIIIENYLSSPECTKIILPSGLACNQLQNIIVKKVGTTILPRIVSINEITFENDEIFKIPSKQIGSITKLEEKIILAQTIKNYQNLGYSQTQALRLSNSLANLFFELESNQIEIKNIALLPNLDKPEHWLKIYDFINQSYSNWSRDVNSLHKMTRAKYQQKILDSEYNKLKNSPSNILILAGIEPEDLTSKNFIQKISLLNNCHLILPPFPNTSNEASDNRLASVHKDWKSTDLDQLITQKTSKNPSFANQINYVEFDNMLLEAEYIAIKCQKILEKNKNQEIAIIAHNQQAKALYSFYLDKYNLPHTDQFGQDILTSPAISLILIISELLYTPFKLKSFFAFLSHPLINNNLSLSLKKEIIKNNKFANSLSEIENILPQETDLLLYFQHLSKNLTNSMFSNNFTNLLKNILLISENIIPDIWQNFPEAISPLRELYNLQYLFIIDKPEDFPDILKQALSGGRFFPQKHTNSIILTKSGNISLANYDLVIMTEMNEGVYPNINTSNPWINQDLQQKLGLSSTQDKLNKCLYEFYLNLQNKEVLITRSKSDLNNKNTLPSQFLLNLQKIMGNNLVQQFPIFFNSYQADKNHEECVQSDIFPDIIYATDIELLIKSPYNFYAKKILGLKQQEEINERPNLAEFGNFFHNIMEEYSNNFYINDGHTQLEKLQLITKNILEKTIAPSINKKMWKTKIDAMATEIINFEQEQRKTSSSIFTEIKGQAILETSTKNIIIAAIADRIEISEDNIVSIIDYKTGAAPTKKEVLSGKAPQLLIEAIIFKKKGFRLNNFSLPQKFRLIYIKINSRSPYITKNIIEITSDELEQHELALVNLLNHYIHNSQYPIALCEAKYDDYSHLARRE